MNKLPELSQVVAKARAHLRDRQRRSKYLDSDLFGEPAWDMLVDLFVHQAEGKKISISSCQIASGVPPTTALRHLGILEARSLVERQECNLDGRRRYLNLSQTGFDRVFSFFVSVIMAEEAQNVPETRIIPRTPSIEAYQAVH